MIRLPTSLAALLLAAPAAADQAPCRDRQTVLQAMRSSFGELPQALGLSEDGRLIEVLVSDATGTWTIIATTPDGISCLLHVGSAWVSQRAAVGEPM